MPLKKTNELCYVLGMLLCGLGVALSAKSGFGVSMVVAPAYVLHCFLVSYLPWFTFGISEYVLQGAIILVTALVCRRFKWKYLFSLFAVLFYGSLVDLWRALIGTDVWESLAARILSAVAGEIVTAFAIALLLGTYLPQQAYELFVQEVTERFSLPLARVKWGFDLTTLVLAVVLMFLLVHRFDLSMVGIGTLVITLVNAPLIAFFSRLLKKICDFSPAFPAFRAAYLKRLD